MLFQKFQLTQSKSDEDFLREGLLIGNHQGKNVPSIRDIFEKIGTEYVFSSPFLPQDAIQAVKEELPGADMSTLERNSVRNYVLQLPIQM